MIFMRTGSGINKVRVANVGKGAKRSAALRGRRSSVNGQKVLKILKTLEKKDK